MPTVILIDDTNNDGLINAVERAGGPNTDLNIRITIADVASLSVGDQLYINGFASGIILTSTNIFNGFVDINYLGGDVISSDSADFRDGSGAVVVGSDFTLSFTQDTSAPTVTSIVRANSAGLSTNADSVTFTVTFSEDVTNIDVSDFDIGFPVGGPSAPTVNSVSATSGNSVDVTVSLASTPNSNGSLSLSLDSGNTITDIAGNPLSSTAPTTTETYYIDNTPPTVSTILVSPAILSDSEFGANALTIAVTFSESMDQSVDPVVTFSPDVSSSLINPQWSWNGNGSMGTVTFELVDNNIDVENIGISISNAVDVAGNTMAASGLFPNQFTVDTTADVDTGTGVDAALSVAFVGADTDFVDSVYNQNEPISVEVSGLDADATGTVVITSSGGGSVTRAAANGVITLNSTEMGMLMDGNLSVAVNVTDDAGNAASVSTNSFSLETLSPTLDSAVFSDIDSLNGEIADVDVADSGVTLTLTFSEIMDTSSAATAAIGVSLDTTELTETGRAWNPAGDALIVSYSVADNNVEVSDISVTVTGAQDDVGNALTVPAMIATGTAIDTLNPPAEDQLSNRDEIADQDAATTGTQINLASLDGADGVTYTLNGTGGVYDHVTFSADGNGGFDLHIIDSEAARSFFDLEEAGSPIAINIIGTDNAGNTTESTVTVNLDDVNDFAVVTGGDVTGSVTERADGDGSENEGIGFETTGTISFTDDDVADNHFISVSNVSSDAPGGVFLGTFAAGLATQANGGNTGEIDWTFDDISDAEMAQFVDVLADGETIDQVFRITITDSQGGSTTEDVTITITGSNDRPTIEGNANSPQTASEAEGTVTLTGTVNVADVDATDAVSISGVAVAATGDTGTAPLGVLDPATLLAFFSTDQANMISALNSAGSFDWEFEATDAFDYLAVGETLTLTYTVSISDDSGASDATETVDIVLNIQGTNDAPVISVDALAGDMAAATRTELDAGLMASDTLTVTDLDVTDVVTVDSVVADLSIAGAGSAYLPAGLDADALQAMFSLSGAPAVDGTTSTDQITWTFDSGSEAFNFLNVGDNLQLTYTIFASDDNGATSDGQTVTIFISGTNDAPTLDAQTGSVAALEDGAAVTFDLSTIGDDADDENDGSNLTYSIVTAPGIGEGSAIISGTTLTFNPGSDFQDLAAGETQDVMVEVQAIDVRGVTSGTQMITFTVTGVNDGPTVTAMTNVVNTQDEGDLALTASGSFDIEDVDTTDVVSVSSITASVDAATGGNAGTLSNADLLALLTGPSVNDQIIDGASTTGTVSWAFASADNQFDYLAEDESVTIDYVITVSDDDGTPLSAPQTVSVTINGTNDRPEISVAAGDSSVSALTESADVDVSGDLTAEGTLTLADADVSDSHTVASVLDSVSIVDSSNGAVTPTASLGAALANALSVSIDTADATEIDWSFALADLETDFLAQGDILTVIYNISADDGGMFDGTGVDENSVSAVQTVTITIAGTNDDPIIDAVVGISGTVTEPGEVAPTDPTGDNGPALVTTGTLMFSDDDHSDTFTATVEGAAIVSGNGSGANALNVADIENLLAVDNATVTELGGIGWTFTSGEGIFDYLTAGESLVLAYTVQVEDNNGGTDTQTVTITVQGSNDQPIVTVADPVADTEGDSLNDTIPSTSAASDTVAISLLEDVTSIVEVDQSDLASVTAVSITDATSTAVLADIGATATDIVALFSINGDEVSYDRNAPLFDGLDDGESIVVQVQFDVTSGPDTVTRMVNVEIQGQNDAPFVEDITGDFTETGGNFVGSLTEITDGSTGENTDTQTLSLSIEFDDVELTDTHTATIIPVTGPGSEANVGDYVGTFFAGFPDVATGAGSGEVTFDFNVLDQDIDYLGEGESLVQYYQVTVDDGDDQLIRTIAITLEGTNDAPTVSASVGSAQIAAETEGSINLTGSVDLADVDVTDAVSLTSVMATTDDVSGNAPDAPTLESYFTPAMMSVIADGATTGTLNWNFDVTDGFDYLAAGESVAITYTLRFEDDSGDSNDFVEHDVVITITGTNDAPIVNVTNPADDIESDATASVTVVIAEQVAITDVDASNVQTDYEGGLAFNAATGPAPSAATLESLFTLDTVTGEITYDRADFDYLARNETVTATFDFTSASGPDTGLAQSITLTINGENDAPTIVVTDPTSVTETDASTPVTVTIADQVVIADADNSDVAVDYEAGSLAYGSATGTAPASATIESLFTLDSAAGTINYDRANFDYLADGDTVTVTFDFTSASGPDAGVAQQITLTITGENDAPIIAASTTSATFTDTAADDTFNNVSGTLSSTDVDNGATATFGATGAAIRIDDAAFDLEIVGDYGVLVLNSTSGAYEYRPNDAAIEGLTGPAFETFTLTVTDDQNASDSITLTINANGVNDDPELDAAAAANLSNGTEDTAYTVSEADLLSGWSDRDDGDVLSVDNVSADNGAMVTDNLDGTYTITPAADFNGTVTLSYNVTDGTSPQPATQTVEFDAVNDAPVAETIAAGTFPDVEEGEIFTGTLTSTPMGITDIPISLFASDIDSALDSSSFSFDGASIDGEPTVTALEAGITYNAVTGSFTFDGTVEAYEYLADGEPINVVVDFTVTDLDGLASPGSVTFTVRGTNDAPTISINTDNLESASADVTETDAALTATGNFSVADVDVTDAVTGAIALTSSVGDSGGITNAELESMLTLASTALIANGDTSGSVSWIFNSANTSAVSFDYLDAGDTLVLTYSVTINDGQGGTASQDVTITITGTADAAVIAGDVAGVTTEASGNANGTPGAATDSGQLTSTDVDADNANNVFIAETVIGEYGSLVIDAAGMWTYTVNEGLADVLDAGDNPTDTLTVQSIDGTTQDISIVVNGANDAAVITGDISGNGIVEAGINASGAAIGNNSVTGNLDHTDVDGDNENDAWVAATGLTGTYGTLDIDAAGSWTYTLLDGAANVDSLDDGDTVQDMVTVQTADGTAQVITIDITGSNDAAVVSGADTGGVIEAGVDGTGAAIGDATTSGDLNHTDVDGDDANDAWTAVSLTGTYGDLTLNADGTWNYILDDARAATDALTAGQAETDVFTVTTTDGTEATVTINVTGSGDAATITDSGAIEDTNVVEAGGVLNATVVDNVAGGDLDVADIDAGEDVFQAVLATALEGTYGDFIFDSATGVWSFALDEDDADTQALDLGDMVSDSLTVTSLDGTDSYTITVNITGANDAPVANDDALSVNEGAFGTVNLIAGNGGDVVMDVDVDADAVLNVVSAADIADGGPDAGGSATGITGATPGTFFTDFGAEVTIQANGLLTYNLTSPTAAFNAIALNETATDTFTYTIEDEYGAQSTATVNVTIVGTNDPVSAVADSIVAVENVADDTSNDLDAAGSLIANDEDADNRDDPATAADEGDSFTIVNVVAGPGSTVTPLGGGMFDVALSDGVTVTVNSDGTYTTDIPESLAQGQVVNGSFSYTVQDEGGAQSFGNVTVEVTGVNDAPVIDSGASDVSDGLSENAQNAITGQIVFSDVDNGDTPDATVDSSAATLTYTPDGGTAGALPTGLDASAIRNAFTVDAAGEWTYDGSSLDLEALGSGDTIVLAYTVTVTDDFAATDTETVTITITGANDAPIIDVGGSALAGLVTENSATNAFGQGAISGTILASDVDAGDSFTFAANNTAATLEYVAEAGGAAATLPSGLDAVAILSGFAINAAGTWTYDASGLDLEALGSDDVVTLTLPVFVTDVDGATDTQNVIITISGTNDAPVIVGALSSSANEDDAAYSIDLLEDASDVDADATLSVDAASVSGLVDGVVLNGNTLDVDPANAAFQSLSVGDSAVVTVNYNIVDGDGGVTSQVATLTINGTNDLPEVTAITASPTDEDQSAVTIELLDSGQTDVDANDTLSVNNVMVTSDGIDRTVTFTITGSEIVIDPSQFNDLAVGESETVTVTYNVNDGTANVQNTATLVVNGANDAPVVTLITAPDTDEDQSPVTIDLLDSGQTDADASDVLTAQNISVTASDGRTVLFSLDGGEITIDPSQFNNLDETENLTLTVNYDVSDGTVSVANMATLLVEGVNDAPVVTPITAPATDEDQSAVTINLVAGQTDPDTSDVLLQANNVTITSSDGTVVVFTQLDASIEIDPAQFNGLADGESVTLTINYNVSDGTADVPNTATLLVEGVNDAPVVTPITAPATDEDQSDVTINLLDSGQSDADTNDTLSVNAVAVTSSDGRTVAFTVSGSDIIIDPSQFNDLADAESATLTVTYNVNDGTVDVPNMATLLVEGVNDAPVVTPITAPTTDEDQSAVTIDLLDSGQTDADTNDTLSVNTVMVTSSDGRTVAFTVSGSDIVIDPSQFNDLADAESATLTVTYNVNDGTVDVPNMATLLVEGVNDAPVVTPITAPATDEDQSAVTINLLAGQTDADISDTLSVNTVVVTSDGIDRTVAFTVSGSDIVIDPSQFNDLAVGETETVTVTYNVNDGTVDVPNMATFVVNGANDAPVVSLPVFALNNEDADGFTVNLLENAIDLDLSDDINVANVLQTAGPAQGFVISGNSLTIVPATFDNLAEGESVTLTFTYDVVDGNGGVTPQTASVQIDGVNDAPVFTFEPGDTTEEELTETDAGLVAAGTLSVGDVDTTDIVTASVTGVSSDGNTNGLNMAALLSMFTLGANPVIDALSETGAVNWTFNSASEAFDHLADGEVLELTYTIQIADDASATGMSSETVTLTITGTNDAPVAVADTANAVEDGAVITGDLSTNDIDLDANAVLTYTTSDTVAGFTLNPDGTFSFDPTDTAYQSLAQGEPLVLTVNYTVTDDQGITDVSSLTINMTGTNDAPVANVDLESTSEDSGLFMGSVAVNDTDVDAGDALTFALTNGPITGLTFNPDGSYTFDTTEAAYQSLAAGQSLQIIATYSVDDGNAVAGSSLILTLNGTNDAPTVAAALTSAATEDDAAYSLDLLSGASDVDSGTVLSVANVAGLVPGVVVNGNSLDIDPADAGFQSLAAGQTQSVTITYDVVDGDGGSVAQMVTLTVTGTNDAPTVEGVVEADGNEASGIVTVDLLAGATDVDAGTTLSVTNLSTLPAGFALSGTTVVVDTNHPDFDALAAGDEQLLTLTYDITDGEGGTVSQTLEFSVIGTNDDPIVEAIVVASGDEGTGAVTVNLLEGASDVDNGDVLSVANVGSLPAGVTVSGNNLIVDTNDAAFDSLSAGQTQLISVTYDVVDENGGSVAQTLEFTITGTNDAPVVAAAFAEAVDEDGLVADIDMLFGASDVDNGDVLSVANVSALPDGVTFTAPGTLSLDATDASFQSLAVGETTSVTVTWDVTDGTAFTPQSVTYTITGTNDGPTVEAELVAGGDEGTGLETVDLLAGATDIDIGDELSIANVSALPAGVTISGTTLTVDTDDAAFDSLSAGATQLISVSFDIVDGNGGSVAQTLEFTITGTNDAPVVGDPVGRTIEEDIAPDTIDMLGGASDVDSMDILTVTNVSPLPTGVTQNGTTLTIDPSNEVFQSLAVGQQVELTVTFDVTDGTLSVPQTAIFIVTGANDTPTVDNSLLALAIEGEGVVTFDLLEGAADVDATDTLSITNVSGLPAGVTVSGTDLVVDTNHPDFETLGEGDIAAISVTYDISDGNGGSVSQTIDLSVTGTNDAPIVNAPLVANVTEDTAPLSVSMLEGASDVDEFNVLSVTNISTLPAGISQTGDVLTIDPSDAAFQSLAEGEELELTVTFDVTDGDLSVTQSVTFTVTGTDDAPVVTGSFTAQTTEGNIGDVSTTFIGGTLDITDIDNGETPEFADIVVRGDADLGTFVLNNGVWGYVLDETMVQDLDDGDVVTDTVTFTASDGTEQTVSVEITGTEDASVVTVDETGMVTEGDIGEVTTVSGTLTIEDLDADDTPEFSEVAATTGDNGFGTFELISGQWTYTLDQASVQSLSQGDTETDSFTFTATDGTVQVVTVTILGSNELIVGDADDNTLTGTDFVDEISGLDGDDIIDGLGGVDILSGGAGDDTFIIDVDQVDTVDGGTGSDTVVFVDGIAGNGVGVSLADGTVDAAAALTGVENVVGTENGDSITGSADDNIIEGLGGSDSLNGGAGTDTLSYESSDAAVSVNLDTGAASGGDAGGDSFVDFENLLGSAFDDTLTGSSSDNVIEGGAGADVINGLGGVNTASYENADAGVTVDLTNSGLGAGDAAGDTLTNIDILSGSDFDDIFIRGNDAQTYNGRAGTNTVSYQAAMGSVIADLQLGTTGGEAAGDVYNDIQNLIGSSGDDRLLGDGGSNVLEGNDGEDALFGRSGDDVLLGGASADRLDGGNGNDTLIGGTFADVLIGGAGDDFIDGGTNFDTALYTGLASGVTVDLTLTTAQDTGGGGVDTLVRVENLVGSGFDDTLTGSSNRNRLEGGAGDDVLFGLSNNDTLLGGAGDDDLWGGTGADRLVGGAGNDDLYGEGQRDRLEGGAGNDNLFGGDDVDRLLGGDGDDMLVGGAGTDFLFGGAGNDSFVFTAVSDSGVGPFSRDEIRDWNEGDTIDVSAIDADTSVAGDQAFSIISGGFTGTAGEVMIQSLVQNGQNIQLLSFDIDGDSIADMQIWVLADMLDADDFLL